MRRTDCRPWLFAVLSLALAAPSQGDVWDPGDDDNATDNSLIHGSQQMHNLIAPNATTADEDWFAVHISPRTSWRFIMEGMGPGILGTGDPLTLVDFAGALVAGSSLSFLPSRSVVFENAVGGDLNYFVRATATGCTTTCGSETTYQIRAYDTTLAVPRFNNSGTQTTFLVLQNRSPNFQLSGHVWFYAPNGVLLANQAFTLSFNASMVLNTSTVPGAAGTGGTMQISHTGEVGQLDGKAVSLEPATGFTFDTPVIPREH